MASPVVIRPAVPADFPAIWAIYREVLASGESYSYGLETTEEDGFRYWFGPRTHAHVATIDGEVAGASVVRPNRLGRAGHVANASFVVGERWRGNGIGKKLGEHALALAKNIGFQAMQFNFVISTNTIAISIYKSLGFTIVGTLPKGFDHASKGLVDVYVMHKEL